MKQDDYYECLTKLNGLENDSPDESMPKVPEVKFADMSPLKNEIEKSPLGTILDSPIV